MLSTCARRRGEGKWSRRTLAMKELPKDAGTLGGCMLLTLSIVFSLGDGIQERQKCVLVAQLCPTLCSTMDCSLPSSSVHGTLQARILEWVAISFSRRNDQGGSKVTQGTSPPAPKDPIHCVSCSVMSDSLQLHGLSPPGSSVHGILQARVLEWVAIPFSRASSQPRDPTQVSCIAGGFFCHLSHQGSPSKAPKP